MRKSQCKVLWRMDAGKCFSRGQKGHLLEKQQVSALHPSFISHKDKKIRYRHRSRKVCLERSRTDVDRRNQTVGNKTLVKIRKPIVEKLSGSV